MDIFYKNYESYQLLSDRNKEIFDLLYLILQVRPITSSNKDLVKDLNMILNENITVSIIEKTLNKLEKSRLIIRTRESKKDIYNGKWRTISREIKLNPNLFITAPDNINTISDRIKQAIIINETIIKYNDNLKKYDENDLIKIDKNMLIKK